MRKVLILNGPNINMLGTREPEIYGTRTYKDLKKYCKQILKENGIKGKIYCSNIEGKLVSKTQKAKRKYDAIIMNPGGYTHTSVALLDAVKACKLPVIIVHLSNPNDREDFRKISYIEDSKNKRIYLDEIYDEVNEVEEFYKKSMMEILKNNIGYGYIATSKGKGFESYKIAIDFFSKYDPNISISKLQNIRGGKK